MRKYISESQDNNFVYPNNNPYQYGVELVQDINNNSVTGTVTNFVAIKSGANINVSFDYTWAKNNAEPFISESNRLNILSVHMMTPDKVYYKPWRLIDYVYDNTTTITTKTGYFSASVTPSQMGQTTFSDGTYYFEVRMIGHRAIYPICVQGSIVNVTPTPTPTNTPTSSSGSPITPTPTPSSTVGTTPTPTPTPSANVLTSIGTTDKVGATTCSSIGTTPEIFLNSSDYAKFVSNGGCFSNGGSSTVSVIRDAAGSPILGTFYFTWYGGSCSYTTFKSTNGNITLNPTQC